MKDLMIDIETLDTKHSAVITQISACYFDRYSGEIGKQFSQIIQVQDNLQYGRTIGWDTVLWWSWLDNAKPLASVLNEFYDFAKDCEAIWSHCTFDIPILISAYDSIGHKPPFHYRISRDIRTLVDLAKKTSEIKDKTKAEKTHNGLEDCIYQVKYCVECFNILKGE